MTVTATSSSTRQAPAGFTDSSVGTVAQPTGMAWTPDGRMLVISKLGELVVMAAGRPDQPAINLGPRVCTAKKLGLLGIAVDPAFATNKFVYLYYSRHRGGACGEPLTRGTTPSTPAVATTFVATLRRPVSVAARLGLARVCGAGSGGPGRRSLRR
jgi:glucose/arabinose dehydrogenase